MSRMRWKHTGSYHLSKLLGRVVVNFLEVNILKGHGIWESTRQLKTRHPKLRFWMPGFRDLKHDEGEVKIRIILWQFNGLYIDKREKSGENITNRHI